MISTSSVAREKLNMLPDDVVKLIVMGRYTLYRVSSSNKEVEYALRTGASEVYFLSSEGEAIPEKLINFEIEDKIVIEDTTSPFVISNFSLACN